MSAADICGDFLGQDRVVAGWLLINFIPMAELAVLPHHAVFKLFSLFVTVLVCRYPE